VKFRTIITMQYMTRSVMKRYLTDIFNCVKIKNMSAAAVAVFINIPLK